MKKLILFLAFASSIVSVGQTSGDRKTDQLIKQLKAQQNAPGNIAFRVNGKTISQKASFIEGDNKQFIISSLLTFGGNSDVNISLSTPTKKTGVYPIEEKKSGLLLFKGKVYQIRGTVYLKVSGKQVSGTFSGELHEIKKNSPKPSDKSDGKITGDFKN